MQAQIFLLRPGERLLRAESVCRRVAEELSQSTMRVRGDARGRVRRPRRNRYHVVVAGCEKQGGEPEPCCRGRSLWTALSGPWAGRVSLQFLGDAASSGR